MITVIFSNEVCSNFTAMSSRTLLSNQIYVYFDTNASFWVTSSCFYFRNQKKSSGIDSSSLIRVLTP
jgi:hypothetical protein